MEPVALQLVYRQHALPNEPEAPAGVADTPVYLPMASSGPSSPLDGALLPSLDQAGTYTANLNRSVKVLDFV